MAMGPGKTAERPSVPVLLVHWERVLGELLDRTAKFPRRVRPTLTNRVENAALDVLEGLIEARYAHDRVAALARASLALDKLRVLLRISHHRRFLAHGAFERVSAQLDEAGRMLGGWLSHARGQA